jgi:hypothetical protein
MRRLDMFKPKTIYLFIPGNDVPEEFEYSDEGLSAALTLASAERIAVGLPPVSHVLVISNPRLEAEEE